METMKRIRLYLLLLLACILSGCSGNNQTKQKDYSNIIENPNISIPGYESLAFKAGKKKQSVNFYNPKENTCYFRISLIIEADDGQGTGEAVTDDNRKETEEVLWISEYLEPGEEIGSIKLSKELDSGDYPATLRYECFSLKDETPLNGSKLELTINVR